MTKFEELYLKQKDLQSKLMLDTCNQNIPQWYASLTLAMIEIGEALAEDTRWKRIINNNTKEPKINRENVVEETADVCIYILNACIFYGIKPEELVKAIENKQNKNIARLLCSKR